MEVTFEQIVLIVAGLIIIGQQFYIHKSVPMDKVASLLKQLRPIVESTPTKLDDFALDSAEDFANRVQETR